MAELEMITELLQLALKLTKKASKSLPSRSKKLSELGVNLVALETEVYRIMSGN